ncbi:hypothetical protein [Muricoccus aerilatus]|uniref:hypothetical protein n=1 Tax=Muricoccus aerilatus TaxID=452982 RepID=UPI0005C1A000|nr:hypothetical protein [Roseomonas aerilata]
MEPSFDFAALAARATAHNPDAELIRLCDAHPTLLAELKTEGAGHGYCRRWQAYERNRDAISAAVPMTMAGIVAKALAARAEARGSDETVHGTVAELWAWDLVKDLVRLEGEG